MIRLEPSSFSSSFSEPVCNRCGRCCYYLLDGKWKKCKNLIQHGALSSCRIWNNPDRVGTLIDEGVICNEMRNVPHTYVGCPYNKEKPIVKIPVRPFLD